MAIRRVYIVGTAVRKVIFCWFDESRNGDASRFHTLAGVKGDMNSIVDPANIGVRIAFTVPWMWCKGSRCNNRSLGLYFHASISEVACAVNAE